MKKTKKSNPSKLSNNYEPYTLEDLSNLLEEYRSTGEAILNVPRAFLCLVKEIKKIDRHLSDIMEMYRKLRTTPQSWGACPTEPWTQDGNPRCHP